MSDVPVRSEWLSKLDAELQKADTCLARAIEQLRFSSNKDFLRARGLQTLAIDNLQKAAQAILRARTPF
jgi:hypothetical protein